MIKVKYFASVREATGCSEEALDAADFATIEALWRAVRKKYDLPERALCAVNHEHADFATPIKDGDEVAFFPQITGG